MMIEYAQLLSTAHRETNSPYADRVYKATHRNHPSAVWVRQSQDHYTWLFEMWRELANEFYKRRGKHHASWTKMSPFLRHNPPALPCAGFTDPPQCMPDEVRRLDTTSQAYRDYYAYKSVVEGKRIDWTWGDAQIPWWFSQKALDICPE
jgi:hypothetical protein